MYKLVALVFLLLRFPGCPPNDNGGMNSQSAMTDKFTYAKGEQIVISVTSNSDKLLFVSHCCSSLAFHVERFQDGKWNSHQSHGLPCLAKCDRSGAGPIVVRPTEPGAGQYTISEAGTYRFRIPYGDSDAKMENWLVSNQFDVQ